MEQAYTIIIDTREQDLLEFPNNKTIHKKLDVGDYAAELPNGKPLKLGGQPRIIFERKSGADLYGSLTTGHPRFYREWQRAKQNNIRLKIIVECNYTKFINKKFKGNKYAKLRQSTLTKILHSSIVRNDLDITFCKDRTEMIEYIVNTYNAIYTQKNKTDTKTMSIIQKLDNWIKKK